MRHEHAPQTSNAGQRADKSVHDFQEMEVSAHLTDGHSFEFHSSHLLWRVFALLFFIVCHAAVALEFWDVVLDN